MWFEVVSTKYRVLWSRDQPTELGILREALRVVRERSGLKRKRDPWCALVSTFSQMLLFCLTYCLKNVRLGGKKTDHVI